MCGLAIRRPEENRVEIVAEGRSVQLGRAPVKFRFPLVLVTVGCGSLCNLLNWIKRSAIAVCAYYGK